MLAVIRRAFELDHLHPRADEVDEGQEQPAVQPVLVEILGRAVRGGDDDDARIEEPLEQPSDHHRVGDVDDLHLIKAEKAHPRHEVVGDGGERVRDTPRARRVHPAVDALHEGVEMDPLHPRRLGRGRHHVHQHRLAAPDTPPEIEALGAIPGPLAPEEARKRAALGRRLDPGADRIEQRQHRALRRIGAQPPRGDLGLVDLDQRPTHGSGIARAGGEGKAQPAGVAIRS